MTCIVGMVASDGSVHLGGDSAGVSGYTRTIRSDPKVFVNGPMAFGFTSSFRMGQLLRYRLTVPKQHDEDLMTYLCGTFIDAVRRTLSEGGWMTTTNGVESGGCFLLGYAGRLFQVDSDFQVAEPASGYAAVGCGDEYAMGALHALRDRVPIPEDRLRFALEAAAEFSTGVAGPFEYVSVRP